MQHQVPSVVEVMQRPFLDRAVRAVADIGSKVYVVRLDAVANFPRLKPLHELSPIEQCHYSIVWNTGRCGSTLMNRSGSSRRTRCTRKMGML